ncbi:hypothetical protein EST38_g11053 [Candolleomyces aberdarensis]|uniref:FHA domain-containing protein n=1 Tax=Candolleomyces aberdarensis TaxID=2316362 RepID=A0A4Q2D8L8_9AGAR|nr:hypothetical protein EST38_g11053 [Candolleomyces aberdarensis]
MSSRTVTLCPSLAHGSFPFEMKQLRISSDPVFLGSADQTGKQGEPSRKAENHNGWFGPKQNDKSQGEDIYPLSLSAMHARIWADGNKVFIRDVETAFGTYVNGTRIAQDVELKSGDVVPSVPH